MAKKEFVAKLGTMDAYVLLFQVKPYGDTEGLVLLDLGVGPGSSTSLNPQQALLLSKKLWEWADSVEPGILLRAVEGEGEGVPR